MSWPARPPAHARCDATVGWYTDQCGAPKLKRCPKLAIETCLSVTEMWLCESCAISLADHKKVRRNPKRKNQ